MAERGRFIRNVVIKGLILFAAANALLAAVDLLPLFGRISVYNRIVPGRVRLPYGDDPAADYSLSLYNLEAMFASHEIDAPRAEGEFRVVLIGDSATWGFLLEPEETLAAQINRRGAAGIRIYNLGYPTMTLTKDLLMLDRALRRQVDLIVWLVTLESMPQARQLESPILQNNAGEVRRLIAAYGLASDPEDPRLVDPAWWDRTLVGGRRDLADLVRLQMYGFLWAATGVDQSIPADFDRPLRDLEADESFHGLLPPELREADLAFDVLAAGRAMAGSIPLLIVNEPIYVSDGLNSGIRYNFFYPRWAYDRYRAMLAEWCRQNGAAFYDWWDLVPPQEFSNSAIHRTPEGEAMLAGRLEAELIREIYGR
ncbi:MAG: hypothetical protein JW929_02145 [Anaerolineales bacterium]|nr:hypothetical protein [Anaerolineales bacterium]